MRETVHCPCGFEHRPDDDLWIAVQRGNYERMISLELRSRQEEQQTTQSQAQQAIHTLQNTLLVCPECDTVIWSRGKDIFRVLK